MSESSMLLKQQATNAPFKLSLKNKMTKSSLNNWSLSILSTIKNNIQRPIALNHRWIFLSESKEVRYGGTYPSNGIPKEIEDIIWMCSNESGNLINEDDFAEMGLNYEASLAKLNLDDDGFVKMYTDGKKDSKDRPAFGTDRSGANAILDPIVTYLSGILYFIMTNVFCISL